MPAAVRSRPFTRSSIPIALAVFGLLALHFALAVGSKRHESTTSDELVHLTAGFSYWEHDDYRLHPENGILPQRWAALPTWLKGAKFPELAGNDYWRTSDAWVVGHQFFYETGEDHFPRLMAGRAMIALFSVATGLMVFFWSRQLFGNAGGLISLGFFAFCPTFLAHGALVTSDVCMALFFLAASGAWWRHLHAGTAGTWCLSVVAVSLAFVAKFTAVLLLPMLLGMTLVWAMGPQPLHVGRRVLSSRWHKLTAAGFSALAHGLVAAAVIWAFYGFRFSAFNPALPAADHFIRPLEVIARDIGGLGEFIKAAGRVHALPEAFLYGFAYVVETTRFRSAFLNGEYSFTGWSSFFVWTFFLKTTLPVLAACLGVLGVALHRWFERGRTNFPKDLYRLTPLLLLLGVYWGFSIRSHLNIGHRHLLPIYPPLFIAMGALGPALLNRPKTIGIAVLGLLGWHAVEAARTGPDFIAYFNPVAGGAKNGHRHLVDSSLDWGQDLPGLKTWLDANNSRRDTVFISYFGTGEPAYYNLSARRIAFINNFKFPRSYVPLEEGIYCISATSLSQVYSDYRGPWTLAFEKRYQQLRALEEVKIREGFERDLSGEQWQEIIREYDFLRFARLCHYLRVRTPDAEIGYSICLFRLTRDEVARATAGSLADWSALIEQAVTPPSLRP